MSRFAYEPMVEADVEAASKSIALAFGFPPDDPRDWISKTGIEEFRSLRDERGKLVGTALLTEMGIYFGGRSVPMTGVAGVTVTPEARGRGAGTELMRSVMGEIKASGVPLSVLYESTQPIYRRVGYEQAGLCCALSVDTHRIDVRSDLPPGVRLREFEDRDLDAVRTCYAQWARLCDGYLDRRDYIWKRVLHPKHGKSAGWLVEDEERRVRAYAFLRQEASKEADDGRHDLILTDLVAADPDGARAIVSFLGGFRSMAHAVRFHGGPAHPLLLLLSEHRFHVRTREVWLMRVVDVKGALESRGYPRGVAGEAHLDVADELFEDNTGPIVLRVADGVGRVEPGGRGHVRLSARALAPLYSGYYSPEQLAAMGLIEGEPGAIRDLGGVFVRGTPAMPDMF